jgi:5-methyltetrahydrofolate--homocysteine methyltransferase
MPGADATRAAALRSAIVADGAMGTMLQAHDLTLDDFEGLEGCNEILNVTRPGRRPRRPRRLLRGRRRRVETNTFGANLANLGEYDIADRIYELAEAGARIAREVADGWSTPTGRAGCSARSGPGTKLPTLGHATYADAARRLRDAGRRHDRRRRRRRARRDRQDLLQAKAAIIGAKRAMRRGRHRRADHRAGHGRDHRHACCRLRDRRRAHRARAARHRRDRPQLRDRPGRDERAPALPRASTRARSCRACPTPACPSSVVDGAHYPSRPTQLADAHDGSSRVRAQLVGGCCGTTPEHLRAVVERVGGRAGRRAHAAPEPGCSRSTRARAVPPGLAYLAIGERTNANGSRKFRDAMLESRLGRLRQMARDQVKDGAHLLDVCVDYVGRDGAPTWTRSRPVRHAGHAAARARLDRAAGARGRARACSAARRSSTRSTRGRRRPGSSAWTGDAARARARRRRDLPHIDERARPARRVEGAVAERHLRRRSSSKLGHRTERHHRRLPHLPARHRPGGDSAATRSRPSRRSAHQAELPGVQTTLGLSNVSFGLKPAARTCSTRCSCTSASRPASTRRSCTRRRSCRCTRSPTSSARSRST